VVLKNPDSIALPFFYISGLALLMAGIFTTRRYPNIHKIMAGLSATLAGIGVLIISISLIGQNTLLVFVTLLATLSIPVGFSLRKKLPGAWWELIILDGIIILNITLSYPLIFK
jgi:uncharacterized membrane protein YcfT